MVNFSRRFNCFFLSGSDRQIYEKTYRIGRYYLSVDSYTQIDIGEKGGRKVVVLGDVINVLSGNSSAVAQWLSDISEDIDTLISAEKELGGQYLIFFSDSADRLYVIGDATCSIPIFYSPEHDCCSNSAVRIAETFGLKPDPDLVRLKDNTSDRKIIMPGDVTVYKEIFCLLPNHYCEMTQGTAVRFVNAFKEQEAISPKKAAQITHPMILRIAEYYYRRYPILCPVTAGRDSRLVLAYFSKISGNTVNAYTFRHKGVTDESDAISIPRALCDRLNISFTVYEDLELPDEWKAHMDHLLGENCYSKRLASVAYTMGVHLGDFAAVNGDIVGQIGKSSIHRSLPVKYAEAKYFTKRLHNFDRKCPQIIDRWIKETSDSGEKIELYDLFSIESRLARMFGPNNMMRSEMGQKHLNIFNSRSIIYCWTAVSRDERIKDMIHRELLKLTVPALLEIPYESQSKADKLVKNSHFLFRMTISAKYFIDKVKH